MCIRDSTLTRRGKHIYFKHEFKVAYLNEFLKWCCLLCIVMAGRCLCAFVLQRLMTATIICSYVGWVSHVSLICRYYLQMKVLYKLHYTVKLSGCITTSSSDSSYPFQMLDIIQTILTFCTAAWNKSVVFMLNQVLKFLSHVILGRPTPLFLSTFPCSMDCSK